MNILFINDIPFNPTLGGIERVTDLLTKSLLERGYNIYYLSGPIKTPEMLAYTFPVLMHTLPEEGLFKSERNRSFYKDFIIQNNINIVINQRGLDLRFECFLEIGNLKRISVLHSTPYALLNVPISFSYNSNKLIDKFKILIKYFLYPFYILKKRLNTKELLTKHYNYISNNSEAIVLLSPKYKQEFLSFNIKKKNTPIISIPNPNSYPIQDIDLESKEKIILFVGRLESEDKNPIQMLKVWKILNKKHTDWKLFFVGKGSEIRRMKLYVIRNNLLNVKFMGNQSDVREFYKTASFICLTSNFEGWPMTLTEGMSMGCIPFTFDSFKAASDIINDGITGHLIRSFNIKEYAIKLSALMDNKTLRINMASEALKKVRDFDIDKITDQWEKIINSI